ncbi:hypothetical protein SAMN06297280_1832 [Arsukibacterium tuosuense]|uniref:PAS domain-containing protein n=1 Tax=Arsukibacterium tuosuense TaxID=1323745 RepID=A0A285IWT9_9GAMM|nr:hypothetical protein [Arsukibacterium tuosuense]SNY51381.1 hypothetical protein SAMN06297280_1832 [Arsukibacterium tuosuense]
MAKPNDPSQFTASLRQLAEQQLRSGTAQLSTAFNASADALAVLYRLSSAGNTASDGLKLLHELQVHQIELDLQLEQLQQNEHNVNHEFACYQQFFDINPAACFILGTDGIITKNNDAAGRLFAFLTDARPEQPCRPLTGRSFLSLLSASCRPLFVAALARAQRNQQRATLLVTTASANQSENTKASEDSLRLTISLSPDHKAILIMLT